MENSASINCQITWIYTEDLKSSCDFYATQLGLELWRGAGSARIFKVSDGAMIGVCTAFEDRVVEPKGSMITFVAADVDGWYKTLRARGVAIDAPPHTLEQFGIYTFFVRDPNGYVIEFQQFL